MKTYDPATDPRKEFRSIIMPKNRRTLGVELICSNPNCDTFALAILMENSQGCYRVNKYLCADCLSEMIMVIPNGKSNGKNNKQKRSKKKVGKIL